MQAPISLRLKSLAGRHLPFLKIGPKPDREAVMRLRPVRNAAIEWTTNEEGALLSIPARKDRLARAVSAWFRLPSSRAVQLDEVGSYVWSLCDGSQTVDSIVKQTCRQYKMNRREVEISVTTYLQMLVERNFIGLYQRGSAKR